MSLSDKPAPRKWKCDECGVVDFWGDTWWTAGSLMLQEVSPHDVPTLCSDECKSKFELREKAGQVVVPECKAYGYSYTLKKKRKGY